jgi:hypothetical protein
VPDSSMMPLVQVFTSEDLMTSLHEAGFEIELQ